MIAIFVSIITIAFLLIGWRLDSVSNVVTAVGVSTIVTFDLIVYFPFQLWKANRKEIKSLKKGMAKLTSSRLGIVYDENDTKFVCPGSLHKLLAARYFVGIHNASPRTLNYVTVRAKGGDDIFVMNTIGIAHSGKSDPEPIIFGAEHLDPGVIEYVELFYRDTLVSFQQNIMGEPHEFELEGRARDTPMVIAKFRYDPNRSPQIERLS